MLQFGFLFYCYIQLYFHKLVECKDRDLYSVLGISRNAQTPEISKAYRRLSKKFHPDMNSAADAANKFKEIADAYEILRDPDKRARYDQYGIDGVEQHEEHGDNPFDMFSEFFGGRPSGNGRRRSEKAKGKNRVLQLWTTLVDLHSGKFILVQYTHKILCSKIDDCIYKKAECQGPGIKMVTQQLGPGFVVQNQQHDPSCIDAGKAIKKNCKACPNGTYENKTRELHVEVESGMQNNDLITLEGLGEQNIDELAGDLEIIVKQYQHPIFTRQGNDLQAEISITLLEALTGFERPFVHIDESVINIQSQKILSDRDIITISGKGMPYRDSEQFGNLKITVNVKFPESLNDDQKELLVKALK